MTSMKTLSIIDCAVKTASNNCFNRLVDEFQRPFHFHIPSMFGVESIKRSKADGHIIFGSYSNVYEKLEWQRDLAKLMKEELLRGIPVLGICFGHQLMVDAFGGSIGPINSEMELLQGTRELKIINNRFGFKAGEELEVFVLHRFEVKDIPKDFLHLGTSSDCKYDALAHKTLPLVSFQGHPEASNFFVKSGISDESLSDTKEKRAYENGLLIVRKFIEMVDSL